MNRYESIKTVTEPHSKEAGQLAGELPLQSKSSRYLDVHSSSLAKDTQPSTESAQEQEERARQGEKTAENVSYGQAVSEQGFGGKTNEKTRQSIKGHSMPPRDNFPRPILTNYEQMHLVSRPKMETPYRAGKCRGTVRVQEWAREVS